VDPNAVEDRIRHPEGGHVDSKGNDQADQQRHAREYKPGYGAV
jgi:hypothetical protein